MDDARLAYDIGSHLRHVVIPREGHLWALERADLTDGPSRLVVVALSGLPGLTVGCYSLQIFFMTLDPAVRPFLLFLVVWDSLRQMTLRVSFGLSI